jgi:alpha-mannosidase/lysosomal alpha-mannosidase
MEALEQNPQRKFSEVEMKFFSMWWKDQNEEMKERVRKLVNNG